MALSILFTSVVQEEFVIGVNPIQLSGWRSRLGTPSLEGYPFSEQGKPSSRPQINEGFGALAAGCRHAGEHLAKTDGWGSGKQSASLRRCGSSQRGRHVWKWCQDKLSRSPAMSIHNEDIAQRETQAGWSRETSAVAGEVGVLGRSVDLWESTTLGERSEGTCSNARRRSGGCGDGPAGLTAPNQVRELQITLCRKATVATPKAKRKKWNSESRLRENRLHDLMRGGKQTVIGLLAFQSVASRLRYSAQTNRCIIRESIRTRQIGSIHCTGFTVWMESAPALP